MKKAKLLSTIFGILSIVNLVVMCVLIAIQYFTLLTSFTSAPAYVAFFLAIPFIIPEAVFLILHYFFKRRI